ncbi:MAG: dTDP-4-dehydrorhamnose reductase [Desulfomonilaceae bacterium]
MKDFLAPCIVVGARGMLGRDLCASLREIETHIVEMDIPEMDISSLSSVMDVMGKVKPKLVINVAALTDVDGCESQQEQAFKVNATGPENLAVAVNELGSFLVHISTDYVFDGSKNMPYREDDPPNPLGIYGKSKLEGELSIKRVLSTNYCIIRTQWLYGANGKNFVDTIIKAGGKNKTLKIVNDQFGSPTYTVDLSAAIIKLCLMRANGVFHVTNSGYTTWSGFASKIFKLVGLDDVDIQDIDTRRLGRPAPRPLYSVLDNSRFVRLTGIKLPQWEDAVGKYLSGRTF